jgi:hypothetical protein
MEKQEGRDKEGTEQPTAVTLADVREGPVGPCSLSRGQERQTQTRSLMLADLNAGIFADWSPA